MSLLLHWYPGDAVMEFVGRLMLVVTLLIGVTAFLSELVLRQRPAARNALWLGVLVCVAVSPLLLVTVEKAGWVWSVRRPDVLRENSPIRRLHRLTTLKGNGLKSGSPSNESSSVAVPASEAAVVTQEHLASDLSAVVVEPARWTSIEVWQMVASTGILVWLAGVVFLSIRLWHGHRQIRRLMSDLQPIHDSRLDIPLQIVTATFGMTRLPPIATSTTVTGPVVVGLVRSIVVLPDDFVKTATAVQLTDVLIHECAHVLRRDTWIGLLQRLVQLAFWPHPLIYVMNRCLSRACEEVCDNYVLQIGDAAGYAETLLELAERCIATPSVAAALAMFSPRWKLQDRVAGLLDPRRQASTRVGVGKFLSVIGLLIAGGSLLAAGRFNDDETSKEQDKVAVAADEDPEQESESVREGRIVRALQEYSDVAFTDCPLDEVMNFLEDLHHINARLDVDAFQALNIPVETPITMAVDELRLSSVLKLMLEPLSLNIMIEMGELVVTTRAKAAASLHKFTYVAAGGVKFQDDLDDLGDILRAGITLQDLVDVIPQVIAPSSWQKNGGSGTLGLEPHRHPAFADERCLFVQQSLDVWEKIEDFLRELREAVRAHEQWKGQQVETREYSITILHELGFSDDAILEHMNRQCLTGKTPEERRETVTIKGDRIILRQPVWIHTLVGNHFKYITLMFNDHSDMPRERSLERARETFERIGSRAERSPHFLRGMLAQPLGVDHVNGMLEEVMVSIEEQTKTQVFVADSLQTRPEILGALVDQDSSKLTLSNLLDSILVPLGLDWYTLDPDVIVVSTETHAATHLEARAYRTTDLLFHGETKAGLMQRIYAVDPGSWADRGGPGLMGSLPRVLIVTHTRRTHDKIARLLDGLLKQHEQRTVK